MALSISSIRDFKNLLEAPYKEGYQNIKASMWSADPRITYHFSRISLEERIIDFSQRIVLFGIGVVLLIPLVNVVATFALRSFFPNVNQETQEFTELSTVETLVSSRVVINKILPRVMNFLDESGMSKSSIYFCHSIDNIPRMSPKGCMPTIREFTITLNQNKIMVPISLYEHSEYSIFTRLKTAIIDSGLLPNHPALAVTS